MGEEEEEEVDRRRKRRGDREGEVEGNEYDHFLSHHQSKCLLLYNTLTNVSIQLSKQINQPPPLSPTTFAHMIYH